MNTSELNTKTGFSIDPDTLTLQSISLIEQIIAWAGIQGYRVTGNPENVDSLAPSIEALNHSQRKKLRNALRLVNYKLTRRSANRLLWRVFKQTLQHEPSVQVLLSKKEIAIQQARKAWVNARDLAETARQKYREEKGDFYKKKK